MQYPKDVFENSCCNPLDIDEQIARSVDIGDNATAFLATTLNGAAHQIREMVLF